MNVALTILLLSSAISGCNRVEPLPDGPSIEKAYVEDWQEGYLDIHQISTGRGNVAWMIMPDGTTMLVDMGDLGTDNYQQEIMNPRPSASKSPAEWVAQYIENFSKPLEKGTKTDYAGNYTSFMKLRNDNGKTNEQFVVGSDTQFPLKYDPDSYPEFSVRNVAGNLDVWTGTGTGTSHMSFSTTDENEFSCAIRISYGDFSWYTGGDIKSSLTEDAVAKACGPTDVVVCNHHAYKDAMHNSFVRQMQAKAYVIPVWDYYHPEAEPLRWMLSTDLYPGDRMVFAAGLVENNRIRLGENGEKIKPAGHIMVRVYEGGDTWQVFVLNDSGTDYEIIYKTDILQSK